MKSLLKIFILLMVIENLNAATELATFDAFYIESSYVGWIIAAIVAIGAGLIIFFTGGTASPIVLTVGTWIGNAAGLSGVAATNYGLAMIGGGSIAAGGLGVTGGVAILTAALTFSTEVVIDYSAGNIWNQYSYNKFVEESKKLPTLPIPQNEDGTENYKKTIEYLNENIDDKGLLTSSHNEEIIKHSLENMSLGNETREYLLKSYLYFVLNDYKNAKKMASIVIEHSREKEIRRTLPAFIYAVSSLYDNQFDFENINTNYFRYAILAEEENKMIPLMFSIYLDRLQYRMFDELNQLHYIAFDSVKEIAFEIKDQDIKKQVLIISLMKYFEKIKLEQQKILSLSNTSNSTIKDNPQTLIVLKETLSEYKNLLNSMEEIFNYHLIQNEFKSNEDLGSLRITFAKYNESIKYLNELIKNIEEHQNTLVKQQSVNDKQKEFDKPWWKFW